MKIKSRIVLCLSILSVVFNWRTAAFAQGSLTPPATAAASTTTLNELAVNVASAGEQRTPVNAANTPGDGSNSFIIAQAGSYYLTNNIAGVHGKNGISVQANDVTVDLNGFVLGTSGSSTHNGIDIPGAHTNITVRGGTLSNWKNGISGPGSSHTVLEDVRITNSGVNGCDLGPGTSLRSCLSVSNANIGVEVRDNSSVVDCISRSNGAAGFLSAGNGTNFVSCASDSNTGLGFSLGAGCAVTNSTAQFNKAGGIAAASGCTITHCSVDQNSSYGIQPGNVSTISNCSVTRSGSDGINNSSGGGDAVINCTIGSNSGAGVNLGQGSRVVTCVINANTGNGVTLGLQSSLQTSTITSNGNDGVDLTSADDCSNNTISSNAYIGVNSPGITTNYGYGNRIDGNHIRDNGRGGILVSQTNGHCIVVRNSCGNDGGYPEYSTEPGNKVGSIVTDPSGSTTNAWSNFVD